MNDRSTERGASLVRRLAGNAAPQCGPSTYVEGTRCASCRHWRPIAGEVWHPTREAVGDCRLHEFETLEQDHCRRHEPQQGSAFADLIPSRGRR